MALSRTARAQLLYTKVGPFVNLSRVNVSAMKRRVVFGCAGLLFIASLAHAQQVVFSRRVYQVRGRSFQQLWTWSVADRTLTQLTNSPRDHTSPICSADGGDVFFDSWSPPDPAGPPSRWALDRTTRVERPLRVVDFTRVPQGGEPVTGLAPPCDDDSAVASPDRSRVACTAKGEEIVILGFDTHEEIARIPFQQHYLSGESYPPWPLQSSWSPDGRYLLVGTGAPTNSTSPHLDYFVLDLPTEQWTRAFSGNNPIWLPDSTRVVFSTERDLAPLPGSSKHKVWVAHLALYDYAAGAVRLLTSGVSNNEEPTLCR
jgi:hypothetical protein